jgi:Zn finger protein HypA/HybF involved in hydrogenase expression
LTDIDHTPDPLENKIIQTIEKIESQDEEDFYDFCTEYHLEDNIQDNLFNQEFNQPHLLWIFIDPQTKRNTPPITNEVLFAISTRIFNKSHINLFLFGPTNSGKSEFAHSVAKYYKSEFYRLLRIHIVVHFGFSDADLDDIFPNLGYGHLFIRDESGGVSGEDSGLLKVRVGNLIRVIRAHQNSFIYINPDLVEVPLVDYYIRIAGKKGVYYCSECDQEFINKRICPKCKNSELEVVYSKCRIRAIVYYKQVDPLTNRASFVPLGRMYLNLHTDEVLRDIYKEKKDKNIKYLKERSGLLGVHFNHQRISKEAQILAQLCNKKHTKTKIGMQLEMIEYNSKYTMDESNKMIGGTDKHNKLLFEKTAQLLKSTDTDLSDEVVNEGDPTNNDNNNNGEAPFLPFKQFKFKYSDKDILKKAKEEANYQDIDRDFEIYSKAKKGILREQIVSEYSNFNDKTRVSQIKKSVQGLINDTGGKLFEREYVRHLQTLYKDKVVHEGGSKEPDAYVHIEELNELHIFSLKKITTNYLPREEISPEQKYAFDNRSKYKKIRLFIIALINSRIYVREETNFGANGNITF